MRALESKKMLKMSFIGTNTRTQSFAPLINCVIDDVLSQALPHIDKTLLQFIQVMTFCLVDSLLHFANILKSTGLRSGLSEGHRSGAMNAGVSRSRSLIVSRARCDGALTVLLQDEEVCRDLLHDRQ